MNSGAKIFLLLASVALVGSVQVRAAKVPVNQAYPLETFVENYEIINSYLEKNVETDNIVLNLAKAGELLENVQSEHPDDKALIAALQQFLKLFSVSYLSCPAGFAILKANDDALGNEDHLGGGNYPLRRIDRVVEQASIFFMDICQELAADRDSLVFSYKRRSYDEINSFLVQKLPANTDPEVNMAEVDKLLQETVAREGEGALTSAFRLLLALKSVSDRKECNAIGFNVYMRNLIASRQSLKLDMPTREMRRINAVVVHFSDKYRNNCPVLFRK